MNLFRSFLCCAYAATLFAQTQPPTNQSTCGRADPAYIHTANETGGIPMFLQRSEAAKSFHLVRESTRSNVSTVFWATGTLGGKPQTIPIPVDSTTKRFTVTFSVDTKGDKLTLTPPSGPAITEGSASAEVTELNCGRILTVTSPEPGEWRAEINGAGRYWLEAQAQSDIHLIAVEFVRKGGRPGHEGLFRIEGEPVAGVPATLQISLSGGATRSAEFYLVSELGRTLQQFQMQPVNSDPDFLEFVGSVNLPNVPFRVAVAGYDSAGRRYQRFFSNLFHAESVEVTARIGYDELPAGSAAQAAFTVRNIGAARTFKITVTDTDRFISKVEPLELTLDAGESGTIRVDFAVPAGTAPGVAETVVMVAQSIAGPPTSNSSVVHFSVSPADTPNPR